MVMSGADESQQMIERGLAIAARQVEPRCVGRDALRDLGSALESAVEHLRKHRDEYAKGMGCLSLVALLGHVADRRGQKPIGEGDLANEVRRDNSRRRLLTFWRPPSQRSEVAELRSRSAHR